MGQGCFQPVSYGGGLPSPCGYGNGFSGCYQGAGYGNGFPEMGQNCFNGYGGYLLIPAPSGGMGQGGFPSCGIYGGGNGGTGRNCQTPQKGCATGDPHFTGANGQHYDFMGTAGNSYNLLTSNSQMVNATMQSYGAGNATTMRTIGVTDARGNQIKVDSNGGNTDTLSINGRQIGNDGSYLNGEVTLANGKVTVDTGDTTTAISNGGGYLNADFSEQGTTQSSGVWGQSVTNGNGGGGAGGATGGANAAGEKMDTTATDFLVNSLFA